MADDNTELMVPNNIRELFEKLPPDAWITPTAETAETRLAIIQKAARLVNSASYKLKKHVMEHASRIEYCKGRDLTPRGFYCPNPLSDIIATNCKRGRIIKKKPVLPPYYAYYFEDNASLAMIEEVGMIAGIFNTTELLFRFGNYRVGFRFVDSKSSPARYIDVTVECKNDSGEEYIISLYTAVKENGSYNVGGHSDSELIVFSGSMPVKLIELMECIRTSEKLRAKFGIEKDEYRITSRTFEVFYDDEGLPCKCSANGEPFLPGKVKKPVLSGML